MQEITYRDNPEYETTGRYTVTVRADTLENLADAVEEAHFEAEERAARAHDLAEVQEIQKEQKMKNQEDA